MKRPFISGPILKSKDSKSLLQIPLPLPFILRPIGVVEHSLAMSQPFLPVPHVPIPQQLILPRALQPDMRAKPTLEPIIPMPSVLLLSSLPMHDPLPIPLIILPLPLIEIATGIDHGPLACLHPLSPLTLVVGSILVLENPLALSEPIGPLPFVLDPLRGVDVSSSAMSHAVLHFTEVGGPVDPGVLALA